MKKSFILSSLALGVISFSVSANAMLATSANSAFSAIVRRLTHTTAQLYGTTDRQFTSPFKNARAKIDYDFHVNYNLERQRHQDRIIADHLKNGITSQNPKIILTAGAMGAGKGHVLRKLGNDGKLNLDQFLLIDPDRIKYLLPETRAFIIENPETAGTRVHQESAFIQELIFTEALKEKKNIIIDGSLTDVEWYRNLLISIKENHPHYSLEIIHVVADLEKVLARVEKRGRETGRFVPIEKVKKAHEQVPYTVRDLEPFVDEVTVIENND